MILSSTSVGLLQSFWTGAAALGVLVTGALFFMPIGDARFLRRNNINSWRRYVATTSILVFFGGFSTQLVYLILGIISITSPQAPRHYHVPHIYYFGEALFIFGALSAQVLAVIIFYRRRKVIEAIEEHITNGNGNGHEH